MHHLPQLNRGRTWLALFLLTLVAHHPANAQSYVDDADANAGDPPPALQSQPDTVSVDKAPEDERIVERIEAILEATEWFQNIEVKSREGVVTLRGLASNESHKQWAERLAGRTQDVVNVRNEIGVESRLDFSASWSVVRQSLLALWKDFLSRLPLLIAAVAVLFVAAVATRVARMFLGRLLDRSHRMRRSLKDLLLLLTSIAIWIVGSLMAAVVAFPGMTPAKALTVLGLGSVAIGFAFKDIFENVFAGILILWRYPLEIADILQVGDLQGRVEEITVRNTLIRRLDGQLTIVPNATLFKENVDVLTNRAQRRMEICCGVAYGADVDEARDVIEAAVRSCERVDSSRELYVLAKAFGASSIDFDVVWWTKAAPMEVRKSRDEVVAAIKRALDQAGIEIPFPYRTLTFNGPIPVAVADALPSEA
ncbi:MAG: mechanosensitive ion channel [Planctomycetales bacterium]|nr:mechanosensitive ion channel [Planctomycetales bacterium]